MVDGFGGGGFGVAQAKPSEVLRRNLRGFGMRGSERPARNRLSMLHDSTPRAHPHVRLYRAA
jgi:hypothetical protein